MKALLVLVSFVAFAGTAHADKKDKADALFKEGKKLMGEKRYADACAAFEKSYKLDPGIGAQLNIAKCYEEWGSIGRAFAAYQAAEAMAKDAKDSREPKIHELVVALEPSVPHLTIKLPKDAPPDLTVTLDSRPVEKLGEPFVVDPGPHTVEWSVKGAKKSKAVAIERGGDSEITLEMPKPGEADKATPIGSSGITIGGTGPVDTGAGNGSASTGRGGGPKPSMRGRNMRYGGIAMGGAGVLAIGISSYMALSARTDYKDALATYCGGMPNNCDMTGIEITHDARSTANKATVVFVIGVALVGGGAALYLLAPKGEPVEQQTSLYLTPAVSLDGAGIVFGGTL